MSISGHTSLAEIERYTKAANQRSLTEVAIPRIAGPEAGKRSTWTVAAAMA
jgi:hypothetical protein